MPTKSKLVVILDTKSEKTVDGYKINDFVGLYKSPETGKWQGVHIPTGWRLKGGETGTFKSKKGCVKFLERLITSDLRFDVLTPDEFRDMNPRADEIFRGCL